MRAKSIAILFFIVVTLVSLVIWQVDRALYSDQTLASEANARSQLAALIPAAQTQFQALLEHQQRLAAQTIDRGLSEFSPKDSDRVEMIANLQASSSGEWSIVNKAFLEKTPVRSWAENYTTIALKGLNPEEIEPGGTALVVLMDQQRNPFFLWIFHGQGATDTWNAIITRPTVFHGIMDRLKGFQDSVVLVNRQGQILSHTTTEYIGTSMVDDPLVGELVKSGKKSGSGTYKEGSAQFQGYFEQVPGSNTYAVIQRPLSLMKQSREALRWQLFLQGGGLLFVGLALMLFLLREGEERKIRIRPSIPDAEPEKKSLKGEAPADDLTRERLKAYTSAAAALARELNGPVAKILALAKLMKSRTENPEDRLELGEMEELAAHSRHVVTKLLAFAGEDQIRPEPTSLNECLNRVLTSMEMKFNSKGIKVEKNIKRVEPVNAQGAALLRSLEAILTNAMEAMERMPTKKLGIALSGNDQWVTLIVSDSGEGMTREQRQQAFDPFFTTKNRSIHSGLGLSMAMGFIRELGGTIQIESETGRGTTFEIRLPVAKGQVSAKNTVPETVEQVSPPVVKPVARPLPAATQEVPKVAVAASAPASTTLPTPPTKPSTSPATPSTPPTMVVTAPKTLSVSFADSMPEKSVPPILQEQALQETLNLLEDIPPAVAGNDEILPPPPDRATDEALDLQDDEETFVEKRLTNNTKATPPPPPERGVSSKIDRPQIGIRLNTPAVATQPTVVRRPGESPKVPTGVGSRK